MINLPALVRSILGGRAMHDDANALALQLLEHLEVAVGHRLSSHMSQAEIDEFDRLREAGDTEGQLTFLGHVAPDHPSVVRDELHALLATFEQIVAAREGSANFVDLVHQDLRDLFADFCRHLEVRA
jgi:hypothetical protein